ncbi:MAG: hypothetical protein AAF211_04030 [Myxococcota bacterium]
MLAVFLLAAGAHAQSPATDIGTERTLGVGGIFGTATGGTGRVYLGGRQVSLDFAFGAANGAGVYDAVFGHASVHRQFPIATADGVTVPWRLGVGAFLSTQEAEVDGGTALGVRVPLGIDLDLHRAPVQFSFEVAPLSLSVTPAVRYGLDASVAVRVYL